jgi:hypothetical protein
MARNRGRVTRFVVMAMLPAARAQSLGLSRDSAFSRGSNRAIFHAVAKRGFRQGARPEGASAEGVTERPSREVYRLGDEEASRDPTAKQLTSAIGDQDQTVAAFEREVASRFGPQENFRAAWDQAVRIVTSYDGATLESGRRFHEEVTNLGGTTCRILGPASTRHPRRRRSRIRPSIVTFCSRIRAGKSSCSSELKLSRGPTKRRVG